MKKLTNLRQLATTIARLEGKKSQVRIGDIREILKVLVELCASGSALLDDKMTIAPDSALDLLITETQKRHEQGYEDDGEKH